MSYNIFIKEINRITSDGVVESLELSKGVNLIYGKPNTGKTIWLKLLDYLLGDRGTIEDALGGDTSLLEKYIAVSASIVINNQNYNIERNWFEKGKKTKVKINENEFSVDEFSEHILSLLGIKTLHIPKGNPYVNTWPELSFRMMLRHIYRQERFWSDIADRQPKYERDSVISQFLGYADKIYSSQENEIVEKSKKLIALDAQKQQLNSILDSITREMTSQIDGYNLQFVSEKEISKVITKLEADIVLNLSEREALINKIRKEESKDTIDEENEKIITKKRIELYEQKEEYFRGLNELNMRISEFSLLISKIETEIEKLKRSKKSSLISSFPISHCPACDQSIKDSPNDSTCFVCHQNLPEGKSNHNMLDFEISNLTMERKEVRELIEISKKESIEYNQLIRASQEKISLLNRQIVPLRSTSALFSNSGLSNIDTERGRLEEKIENFKRLKKNLENRDILINEIDALTATIASISINVNEKKQNVSYEDISKILEDGMMEYLNEVTRDYPERWNGKRINISISENNITFFVGDKKWSSLSATYKAYFLMAYHYGLFSLSNKEGFNYPGLLILDFPFRFDNEKVVISEYGYLIEPFKKFSNLSESSLQMIVTGRTFKGLEGANRIELKDVWK